MIILSEIRAVSYNILNPRLALEWNVEEGICQLSKGVVVSNWHFRKVGILQNLINSQFSLLCLQEVDLELIKDIIKDNEHIFQLADFSPNIPKKKSNLPHEGVAIFYSAAKLNLLTTKIFNSLRENFFCIKGEIYADFEDKITKHRFRVVCTHLKGYNSQEKDLIKLTKEKQKGLNQLKEVILQAESNTENIDHIIICADLNESDKEIGTSNCRLKYLHSCGYLEDGNRSITHLSTKNKIDWIFFKTIRTNRPLYVTPLLFEYQTIASDHLMVSTKFITHSF